MSSISCAIAIMCSITAAAASSIAAASRHTCVILDNGDLNCFGYGYYGQLGTNRTEFAQLLDISRPVRLGPGRTATALAAGSEALHTCVILDNGVLKCFGRGDSGQLGNNHTNGGSDIDGRIVQVSNSLPAVNL
eukprot:CAMPEP_0206047260 /NCGR_PEP_ID=MMETSP1466-20131121/20809_1 /ASSEMBLY_ACC=CAM_ASM_001126 /TAXON_ID=44452 /ORGANISM="Pavlova gyrans, Strain CCMP608" /LENGTH=133 /DNA_ID=CAMNT_0053422271 /DNA_START=231 /DNA_END=628 /DNA_ORIENTATION=-